MSVKRKAAATLAAVLAVGVLGAPAVQGAPSDSAFKDCNVSDSPKNNWTTEGEKQGSCKSSHELEEETVKNPGGNEPGPFQP
jgi:hypothetical protein